MEIQLRLLQQWQQIAITATLCGTAGSRSLASTPGTSILTMRQVLELQPWQQQQEPEQEQEEGNNKRRKW